jgi:hypothetical protein
LQTSSSGALKWVCFGYLIWSLSFFVDGPTSCAAISGMNHWHFDTWQ